jgi:amino acid transporter
MSESVVGKASGGPGVFTRKSSGLVRVMSPRSAIIYNILTMGIIFPWTFLWAPTAFQGSNLVIGLVIAFVFELPLALSYAWLASAMPRSGGDYVFQSRTFGGGFGFTVVFGLFVVWILQWVALSGWLMAVEGIAPLMFGLSATTGVAGFASVGVWASGATGIIIISLANALLSMVLLISGFRNYVKFQVVIFIAVMLSFAIMLILFFTSNPGMFTDKMNVFASTTSGIQNFMSQATGAAQSAGVNVSPPITLFGTLMVAPIAWTSLQWATYSVEQGSEVKNAHSFKSQVVILLGSLVAVTILLILLALGMQHGVGQTGIMVASSGYWLGVGEATLHGTLLMPNLLAVALTGSTVLVILIGLGYILNSFQIVCNCFIGTTRILVAQSLDGLLPNWFAKVSPRWKTPVNAHVAYFLASVPVIFAYNLVSDWSTRWALGVTFANGLTLTLSGLAAALLPTRNRAIYRASPGSRYNLGNVPWVTVLGGLGFTFGMFMVISFLTVKGLGLAFDPSDPTAYLIIIGSVVFALVVYLVMRWYRASTGVNVKYAFAEVPPE